ncbi:MAG: rhomboid family intramembrane serine protease [Planctomycetota bacterium]|nr:rhomboid family intramembrane serine protease [Planctomycetota bacterium]
MLRPPPLYRARRFPVVSIACVAALAVSAAFALGASIAPLVMNVLFWPREPWRLFTCVLPHANPLHLLFNLYWLWVFGTLVEWRFGSLRTLGILALSAAGSSAAEYAFLVGGVGLSGVGYGLFGLLWVLGRREERIRDAVDRQTVQLFVVWFFVCIVLTVTKVMPVGNIAHGIGAVLGMLLGYAVNARGARRILLAAAAVGLAVLFVVLAGVARPYVNLAGGGAQDLAYQGYAALEKGDNDEAERLLRRSVALDSGNAGTWFNLALAYQRLNRTSDANDAIQHACNLRPADRRLREALAQWNAHFAHQAQTSRHFEEAARLYEEAIALCQDDAKLWFGLGLCQESLGRNADAIKSLEKAVKLDQNPACRAALDRLRATVPKP